MGATPQSNQPKRPRALALFAPFGNRERADGAVDGRLCFDANNLELPFYDPHAKECIEALAERGWLHSLRRGENPGDWHALLLRPPGIACERLANRHVEEISENAKSALFRRRNETRALLDRGIGIVDHASLAGLETEFEKPRFAASGLQHVAINPHMRIGVLGFEKPRFPAALNTDKDDAFHKRLGPCRAGMGSV